ncbi:MAG: type II toxin-antitoxin system prevent-host-death family antitoxin [Bryobacterales bacterium]|nr:type II toxin-antitoxin system prevent-host-death family antitoxin [Bryobacterales bacterium]
MREVQASEAKAHLLRLLSEVERGETLIITRHGRPIARLVPEQAPRSAEIAAAISRIQVRRGKSSRVSIEEILSARDEGRK